jgi:hypothetical protein
VPVALRIVRVLLIVSASTLLPMETWAGESPPADGVELADEAELRGLVRIDARVRYQTDFMPGTTRISELMTPGGDIYLFRVIDQKYVPGYVGAFGREEGAISYSLNPYIAKQWDSEYTRNSSSTLLIARNNLYSDALAYPTLTDYIGDKSNGRLEPGTVLKEIHYLNEVKVPIKQENVLRDMPLSEFQRLAESFGGAAFKLDELLIQALTWENTVATEDGGAPAAAMTRTIRFEKLYREH